MQDIWESSSFPGLERSPGGGHGNPLQYSCLENPMDRGSWQATVHRVPKSQTRLSMPDAQPLYSRSQEVKTRLGAASQLWRQPLNSGWSTPGPAGLPIFFPSDHGQYRRRLLGLHRVCVLICIFQVLCSDSGHNLSCSQENTSSSLGNLTG